MKQFTRKLIYFCVSLILIINFNVTFAQKAKVVSSYGPVNQDVGFDQIKADRMKVKADRAKEHKDLLNARYDLSKKTSPDVVMSGGKPVPVGPTAKLQGINWADLGKFSPEQIKSKDIFPYKPLPFADHAEGGMLFPQMIIDTLPVSIVMSTNIPTVQTTWLGI